MINRPLRLALSLCALALAACGGGGGSAGPSSVDSGYTVSGGTVQKGPLVQGSSITVSTLNSSSWQPRGSGYTFEITNNLGNFSASSIVFNAQYAESTALGYYFDELTGVVSNDMVFLRGLSDLKNDKAINLNVLTNMVKARTIALITRPTAKLSFANARLQAQKELLDAFYIYNSADLLPGGTTGPANFNQLDLSKTRNADQILAAISGVITQMGQNGSGINLALSQLEMDLADDGLINNSPNYVASNVTRLSSAEAATNFTAVANNLNAFYGNTNFTGTSVGQWIDSSGGVDRVIDKNKFTVTGTLNVESKSPSYLAGSDDVGQCISVDAGKLYRQESAAQSATLVATATFKAIAGDRYQIGLTPTASSLSGFIQRSALVGGVCPTVLPTTGLTRVFKYAISLTRPYVTTLAGTAGVQGSPDGTGSQARFSYPSGVATDSAGNVYVTDPVAGTVRKITPSGVVTTLAGTAGVGGYADGTGAQARFSGPIGVATDSAGNVYVGDTDNHIIRKITPAGVVTTLAGTVGVDGSADGTGTAAFFASPQALATDNAGNVYVADAYNFTIRKVTPSGAVTTLAGTAGVGGYADDTGYRAKFSFPSGVATDGAGNVYVADQTNRTIRKITPSGVVTTLAGTAGVIGCTDGAAAQASFFEPSSVATDSAGNVYVTDAGCSKEGLQNPRTNLLAQA